MTDGVRGAGRWAPAAVWAVLLLVAFGVAWWRGPATPVPASAAPDVFSSERAKRAAAPVLAEPRPTGSPANTAARQELVRQLTAQGWQVRVEAGVGGFHPSRNWPDRPAMGGYVHNIVATLPGSDPTGTVVLAAHHDSVPGAPGGGDDGVGVATLLETGRVLAAERQQRNDVVLLLTDGEEDGMLGAEAYVRGPGARLRQPVTVVNHEARGAAGVPIVIRSAGDVGPLLAALPLSEAESFTQVLFQLTPNDTDFSRWRDAGWAGIDTAVTGDGSVYHSPLDTLERLDDGSLQSQGELTLAAARHLASADLTGAAAAPDAAVRPMTSMPWGVLAMPGTWVQLLTVVGLALTAVATWRARRAGALSLRGVAGAVVVVLLVLLVTVAAAGTLWPVAAGMAPQIRSATVGEPSVGWPFLAAELLAVLAGVATLLALTRRRPGWPAVAHAAVLVLGVLTLTGAVLAPALVIVLVVPLLGAAVALLLAGPRRWQPAAVTVALLPVGWMWGSQLDAAVDLGAAGSMGFTGALAALGALGALAAPALGPRRPHRARSGWGPRLRAAGLVLACWMLPVVAVAGGVQLNRTHPDPRQERVTYEVRDGHGSWSRSEGSEWVRTLPDGPAPAWPPPQVQLVAEQPAPSGRTLDLLLSSPRGARVVTLEVNGDRRLTGVTLEDVELPVADTTRRVAVIAPPAEGARVRLQVEGSGPVQVTVTDATDDLSAAPGWSPPPPDLVVVQPRLTVSADHQL